MAGADTHEACGRGINFRALDDLFAIRDSRADEVRARVYVRVCACVCVCVCVCACARACQHQMV